MGFPVGSFNDNRAMVIQSQSPWLPRVGTLAVWLLAAASLTYWGLKFSAPAGGSSVAPVALAPAPPPDPATLARLLGAGPAAAPAVASLASRFALIGVVAGASNGGAALIAIDGKPPKPFRVGAKVEEGLVLQSVAARRAVLGAAVSGPALVTLELPPPKR